jgi:DNA modification methylase
VIQLLAGDCRDVLATLPAESVQCCVTSPPYWNLRDYGTALWDGGDAACSHVVPRPDRSDYKRHAEGGVATWTNRDATPRQCSCGARRIDRQIGLEPTPDEYLATMVAVFREVRRVLRKDGTVWCNIGDSYNANQGSGFNGNAGKPTASPKAFTGLAAKQLLMMPSRLALALQADGWWVRSDIIWHKPNPMPESCTDRPTSAHEHVFLLTRSARYFYDAEAVREPHTGLPPEHYGVERYEPKAFGDPLARPLLNPSGAARSYNPAGRNLRNVWTLPTHPYAQAHFATYPPALAERCIRAGTRLGDTVLDPFAGAGTTLLVADRLQRDAIGIELNPDYTRMAMQRCRDDAPLFTAFPPAEDPETERMADLFADAAE